MELFQYISVFVGGRFCSFSPCIEQVQRCHLELRKHGFKDIQCLELLQREHIVKTKSLKTINLDYLKEKVGEMFPNSNALNYRK